MVDISMSAPCAHKNALGPVNMDQNAISVSSHLLLELVQPVRNLIELFFV